MDKMLFDFKWVQGMRVSAAVLGCALMLSGCGSNDNNVAEVNGSVIKASELKAYMSHKRLPESKTEAALEQYAERWALADIINKEAFLDDTAIEVEVNEFKKELLISRYFDTYLKEQVTDQAVLNYYNSNPTQYEQKRVHVAHILLRTNKGMDESERKVQLTKAQEASSKIKAGAGFGEIAAQYSEDKISGKKAGDLGWLKEGAISVAFSQKVFAMNEGDVSEIFESPFGYHIVNILEAPKVVRKPFESVKGDIRYQLRNQAKKAELKRLLEKTSITIKTNDV